MDYGELKWVRETAVQHISDTLLDLSCQAVRACLIGLELSECVCVTQVISLPCSGDTCMGCMKKLNCWVVVVVVAAVV